MRALELFAGIGGLRLAAPPFLEVVAAYDQDRLAGSVYRLNHPAPVVPVDLSSVSARELLQHEAEAWLLSPPCQPFTERGRKRDLDDARAAALGRLIDLLAICRPRRLLLENVPGFHGSRAHAALRSALRSIGHEVRDVVACPSETGAPVRRRRHFVLGSADGLGPLGFAGEAAAREPTLDSCLDPGPDPDLRLTAARLAGLGLVRPAAEGRSVGTFTRSYGRARRGGGPLHWDGDGARYFSPEEILRLHGFPPGFVFPAGLTRLQRWRLAGNSVHVGCVRRVAAALTPGAGR